jgi:hypothetical protein
MVNQSNIFYKKLKKEKKLFFLSIFICNIIFFINIYVAKDIYHASVQLYTNSSLAVISNQSINDIFNTIIIEHKKKLLIKYKTNINFDISEVNIQKNSEGLIINYVLKRKSTHKKIFEENHNIENFIKEKVFIDIFTATENIVQKDLGIIINDIEYLENLLKTHMNSKLEIIFSDNYINHIDANIVDLKIKKNAHVRLLNRLNKLDFFNYSIHIIEAKYPFQRSFFIHNLLGIILSIIIIFIKKNLKNII